MTELDTYFTDKKVLITGGLGFIGSNLARRLVDLGARVTVLDSLIPQYGGNMFNVHGIERLLQINIADVRDANSMKYLVRGYDILFNLAGQTSHVDSMTDPFTDLQINAEAQLYILDACRKSNPGIRTVFASTRQIYGRPDYLPVDEKHPLRPADINGVNKLAGEWYHLLYHGVYGVRTTVLRLTNTIGPRMRIRDARQTFVGIWIKMLILGRPFDVWGGSQVRDYTYVDDAVEAFLLAAADPAAEGQVFNLGGDRPVTLLETARMLVDAYGSGSFTVMEYPADRHKIDIGDYYADYGKIRAAVGWAPKTPLTVALKKTVDFYKEHGARYMEPACS
jgi:nucleoside-diphosphate-sugar epimerase